MVVLVYTHFFLYLFVSEFLIEIQFTNHKIDPLKVDSSGDVGIFARLGTYHHSLILA